MRQLEVEINSSVPNFVWQEVASFRDFHTDGIAPPYVPDSYIAAAIILDYSNYKYAIAELTQCNTMQTETSGSYNIWSSTLKIIHVPSPPVFLWLK